MRPKQLAHIVQLFAILAMVVIFAGSAWPESYKVLHVFTSPQDAGWPHQHLIFDAAGNLYGTGQINGAYGNGAVYELSPQADGSWTEAVIYSFTGGDDGAQPTGNLIFDATGNLYGTAGGGGAYGAGVAFELTPNSDGAWTEITLHAFGSGRDGRNPSGGLIFDGSGNLYGAAQFGGRSYGIIFELTPNGDGTWDEDVLFAFPPTTQGAAPDRGLVFDTSGNLYGTSPFGARTGCGNAFRLSPQVGGPWTDKTIHNFYGSDGCYPQSTLVFDSAGRLYGTAYSGGAYNQGVVFQLIPDSGGFWTRKDIYAFTGGKDGANPLVGVTLDSAGNVYGTTSKGGAQGDGVVFELVNKTASYWTERVLHTFEGYGSDPEADVIFDAEGNIYGTTRIGNNNNGLVYEIMP
jgi:uncharacterized repeat protein (TIGR03803 family)